jgi:hypothetical protein
MFKLFKSWLNYVCSVWLLPPFASAALGLCVGVTLCDPMYPAGFVGCKLLGFINLKSGSYAFYSKKKL